MLDDLLPIYLAESEEIFIRLETALAGLSRNSDSLDPVHELFRNFHTLKSSSAFLKFKRVEAIAQAAEQILEELRSRRMKCSSATLCALADALDASRRIHAASSGGGEARGDDGELLRRLRGVAAGRDVAREAPDPAAQETARDHDSAETPSGAGHSRFVTSWVRVRADLPSAILADVEWIEKWLGEIGADGARPDDRNELRTVISRLKANAKRSLKEPVGSVWSGLPRVVRETCTVTGKEVELLMSGYDVELHRDSHQVLRACLVHLVRNAIDHGIEASEFRRIAGKRPMGTLLIKAYEDAGEIVIKVADDGGGIDVPAVRERALTRGLATAEQLAVLGPEQIMDLIFTPGLTTAGSVTAVSGRGVGLDVVRAELARIGGTVRVDSTHGQGACFVIRIPQPAG